MPPAALRAIRVFEDDFAIARRLALAEFLNNGKVPLICPARQALFEVPAAACCLAWGCFRYFRSASLCFVASAQTALHAVARPSQ
jgi:hypothetical protein